MTAPGLPAEDAMFVRTYTLTRGRTRPRHVLGLETVLDAGPGQPGPGQPAECEEILALCREHRRSVTELAGRIGRPVTVVRVLLSDLLDARALVVPLAASHGATDADGRPTPQLLAALSVGLKRKWPDADAYPQAG